MAELSSVQMIERGVFDPASLTGSYQVIFTASDDLKILKVFNGSSTVSVDISLDGVTDHDVWPSGATLVIDCQANHADNSAYGAGTLYLRKGQKIWGKTSSVGSQIIISGFR